ncbi:MAG: DNA-processing protein DprA [Planctomycetaceae bacterium]|nr:DNA-processing protein DprA [Planctomycetaceae bacterium]
MPELTENLIRLRTVQGVGNAIIWRLLRHFGDSDRILGASEQELCAVKGVSPALAGRIARAGLYDPRDEMDKAVRAGVDIIPYDDAGYPMPLRHMFDPPVVLYVRGRLIPEDGVAVGIVGTRHNSRYGKENALNLSAALARGGFTIVSGLARGVDTFAHTGALQAGGRTIGVLGCGFDHMYPEENRDLALEMTHSGAVVTEFSMATSPSRDTFPVRNRIIAGLSMGLLVVEAPLRSGSLITARLANEIGRTVFAVPGRMDDARSEGCNRLIRDGAVMVLGVDDIFRELNPSLQEDWDETNPPPPPPQKKARQAASAKAVEASLNAAREEVREKSQEREKAAPARPMTAAVPLRKPSPDLGENERVVLACLTPEWAVVDDLTEACGLDAGKASAALAMLRLRRLAEQGPGQTYRLYRT